MAERKTPVGRRGSWRLALAAGVAVALGGALLGSAGNRPRPRPAPEIAQPEGPPTDLRYAAALRRGRAGELSAARKDLIGVGRGEVAGIVILGWGCG